VAERRSPAASASESSSNASDTSPVAAVACCAPHLTSNVDDAGGFLAAVLERVFGIAGNRDDSTHGRYFLTFEYPLPLRRSRSARM
jgi:hypothetical protein